MALRPKPGPPFAEAPSLEALFVSRSKAGSSQILPFAPYIPSRSRPHQRLVWWTVVAICEVKATCGCACLSSCYRVVGDLPQAPPHSLHKHPTSRLTDDTSHGSRLILSSCHPKHGFANAASCLVRLQPCSCHSFQPGSCCKQEQGL